MHKFRRRGILARVGIVIAAIGAIAAMALPGAGAAMAAPAAPSAAAVASAASDGHTTCTSQGLSTTCTGTYSGDNAYDPWTDQYRDPSTPGGDQISHPPVVTVSQAKDLTDQTVNVSWQYFTPTLDGSEEPNPPAGDAAAYYKTSIYECKGTDPSLAAGIPADDCNIYASTAPDAPDGIGNDSLGDVTDASDASPGASGIPNSYLWGGGKSDTGGNPADWKGQVQFHIEAGKENNSLLACDVNSPCSLLIIPNFGGNYNIGGPPQEYTDTSDCEDHTYDDPTSNGNELGSNAYNGWACSFMDRIVVPLSFAPTSANCPQASPEFYAEGSPMMERQLTQWQSGWCAGSAPVTANFNTSVGEDQARDAFLQGGQALSSRIDMALVTLPPDADASEASTRKFTYAPLANSGTAMAYYLDDYKTGAPLNRVVLDPRLVAKLTTESYSLQYGCTASPPSINGGQGPQWPPLPNASISCDPAVEGNPSTLFDDPEFLALNKDCQPTDAVANYACGTSDFPAGPAESNNFGNFLPTVPGGADDMTYQLTDWAAADSDAAGFLTGKPDLWGMTVNSNYKNTSYPAQSFQAQLDPGAEYPVQPLPCRTPAPGQTTCPGGEWDATMNVAWDPVTGLDHISQNLLAYQPSAENPTIACPINGDACTSDGQLSFPAMPQESSRGASLFSELDLGDVQAYQFPATAMVNAAGDAVAPTQASVEAAVKDMKTNPDGITQYADESSTDATAYPLAMVDYAMVPTCGLPSSEASAIADFLTKAATTGQVQGNTPGDLAPGYYPLTSAQKAQTLKAAQDVKSQDCKTVPPDKTVSGHGGSNDVGSAGTGNSAGTGDSGGSPAGGGTKGAGHGAKTSGASGQASSSSSPANARNMAFGQKSADSGLTGLLVLIAIIAGAVVLVGGSAAWALTATGKWPVVLRWLRPVRAWLAAARTWFSGLLPAGRA